MSGSRSKNKGKAGEREFAAFLQARGVSARRGVQYTGGGDSPDVVHVLKGVHFEVKRSEQLNLYAALEQAQIDSMAKRDVPVVVHRKNRRPWVALLYADDFVDLVKKATRMEEDDG